jgi:GNAT superfamily N-acetyltransferase
MTSTPTVQISTLAQADEPDWRRLWGAYQRFYAVDLSEAVHASTWSRLLDPAEPIHGAIARDGNGEAIGLVHHIRHRTGWNIADSCYLQDLYVDEGNRGTGAGRALIAYVVVAAAEYGAAHVHWLTHETNARAMRLYDDVATRSGFVQYRVEIPGDVHL